MILDSELNVGAGVALAGEFELGLGGGVDVVPTQIHLQVGRR